MVTRTKTQDYQPVITAVVTLLGKDRKEELYKGFHASGYASLDDRWRLSPATASFANFEALIADPNASSRALLEAAGAIASTVGADLRR